MSHQSSGTSTAMPMAAPCPAAEASITAAPNRHLDVDMFRMLSQPSLSFNKKINLEPRLKLATALISCPPSPQVRSLSPLVLATAATL